MYQIARLFPNGQSQAVRLPKEYRFDGDRVYVTRVGKAVVLLPFHAPWQTLFDSFERFTPDFGREEAL
jgi:antitoxin VapB